MPLGIAETLGYFENEIQKRFIVDDCGIVLEKLGPGRIETFFRVDLKSESLIQNNEAFRKEISEISDFIVTSYKKSRTRPVWYRINVIDQAVNDYVGIGFLNIESDWLSFILKYLSSDRAEEGGDTMMILFDSQFKWAANFTLSQDHSRMEIDLHKQTWMP